jgi:hypothetical protein
MSNTNKPIIFGTYEEYLAFFEEKDNKKNKSEGSKHYKLGVDIAKMACEKATNQILTK